MLTAMTPMVWMSLLILAVIYAFVCKNIVKAVDTAWPLFGVSCQQNHSRLFLAILLISMLFLTNAYQAGISSELMAFSEFPSFWDFIIKGSSLDLGNLFIPILPFINFFMPLAHRNWMKQHFHGREFTDILMANASLNNLNKGEFARFLKKSDGNKVVLSAVVHDNYGMGLYQR